MKFVRLFENFDSPALDLQWATGTYEGKSKMTVWKLRDNAYALVNLEKNGDLWKVADKRVDPIQLWYGNREEGAGLPKDMSVDLGHHINDLLEADLEKQLGKNPVNDVDHAQEPHVQETTKVPLMRGQSR